MEEEGGEEEAEEEEEEAVIMVGNTTLVSGMGIDPKEKLWNLGGSGGMPRPPEKNYPKRKSMQFEAIPRSVSWK